MRVKTDKLKIHTDKWTDPGPDEPINGVAPLPDGDPYVDEIYGEVVVELSADDITKLFSNNAIELVGAEGTWFYDVRDAINEKIDDDFTNVGHITSIDLTVTRIQFRSDGVDIYMEVGDFDTE